MREIQNQVEEALRSSANRLRKAGLPVNLVAQFDRLLEQVHQHCVVAIVGRVKAGKSTFVNALLNENLAKVGTTETTATINYFRYGVPHPDFPVRCYRRGGEITEERREFLDNLQGNDLETLRRADDIDHLEYYVQNPHLQEITLVDTPGTGTVIDTHHDRTMAFLNLSAHLRERNHKETERIESQADAVIYLLGEIARENDQALLQDFQQTTQEKARSMNALGVLAKIDLNPEIVKRRAALSQKIAGQLQDSLNTVIPVSAGLHLALNHMATTDQDQLKRLITTLHSIPLDTREYMLTSPKAFLSEECPEFPEEERKALIHIMDWPILTTIANVILEHSMADEVAIEQELRAIAGFDRLRTVLEQHFLKRGRLLRCYRIVNDVQKVLDEVRYNYLPTFRDSERDRRAQHVRFTGLLQHMRNPIARELEAFVDKQLAPRTDLEMVLEEVEREIGILKEALEDHNSDFEAFQQVEEHRDLFKEERDELHLLFGLHTLEIEERLPVEQRIVVYVTQRLRHWDRKSNTGRNQVMRNVAAHAARRYNTIFTALQPRKMP